MITEVAFIVYPVTDIVRSRRFYEDVFELRPTHEALGGTWVEYDIGATTFAIGVHPDWKPSTSGATLALEVDNFDATVAQLKSSGVVFSVEPFETPVCRMAIVTDPDGSRIILHKRKAH